MNFAQRHKMILAELEKEGYVKVIDLSERLGVSAVTIRKDLTILEQKKMLFRSHGSVSLFSSLIGDRHIDEKEKMMVDEKRRIAEAAARLLERNDRIIIASGTTVLAFANKISSFTEPLTIITASVKVSLSLCYRQNIEVIQLGGSMRKNSASVIGHDAENFLKDLSCNKLYIGIDGLDIDFGLTTGNIDEAHLNKAMIRAAQKVIVLADSSKFGKRSFGKICDLDRVHQIITDVNAPTSAVQLIRDKGIEVTLV